MVDYCAVTCYVHDFKFEAETSGLFFDDCAFAFEGRHQLLGDEGGHQIFGDEGVHGEAMEVERSWACTQSWVNQLGEVV